MTDRESANKSLDQFDALDLGEMAQRRLAAYALRDFYGSILTFVGREFLHLERGIRTRGPKVQWKKVSVRLEAIDDFSVPEDFSGLPQSINDLSNDVDHDFEENPPLERLEELREKADDWADWVIEQGETYQEVEGELDVRDTLIWITRQTLQSVILPPEVRSHGFDVDQRNLNEDARELLGELDELVEDAQGITKELVYLLADAKELEQQESWIDEGEYGLDAEMEMRYDEMRERAAAQRRFEE